MIINSQKIINNNKKKWKCPRCNHLFDGWRCSCGFTKGCEGCSQ